MLSIFSLDANKAEPSAILALAVIGGWFLFAYLRAHPAQSTSDTLQQEQAAYLQQASDAALLQSLSGQNAEGTVTAISQPVYSSPATASKSVGTTATGSGA